MNPSARKILIPGVFVASIASLTGCSSTASLQSSNLDLNPAVASRVASLQPSFGVGDELGLMMFSQVALAPEASPTYNVLVIAAAPTPSDKTPSFDWLQGYVALAR